MAVKKVSKARHAHPVKPAKSVDSDCCGSGCCDGKEGKGKKDACCCC